MFQSPVYARYTFETGFHPRTNRAPMFRRIEFPRHLPLSCSLRPRSSIWIERQPSKLDVVGSSPTGVAILGSAPQKIVLPYLRFRCSHFRMWPLSQSSKNIPEMPESSELTRKRELLAELSTLNVAGADLTERMLAFRAETMVFVAGTVCVYGVWSRKRSELEMHCGAQASEMERIGARRNVVLAELSNL